MILRSICLLLCAFFGLEGAPVNNPVPVHEAFVSKYTDPVSAEAIAKKPPAPLEEIKPAQSHPDARWISGYWAYSKTLGDYVWVAGVWRRAPPQHGWINGEWVQKQGGWEWMRGFWSPTTKLSYIEKAPPLSAEEAIPPSPGSNYFWIPGYWDYSSNQYKWISGKWWALDEEWILAPASYIKRDQGYVFVPSYWDYTVPARGTAYRTGGVQLQVIKERDLINQLFIHYPDYLNLFQHWNYFNPDWGKGAWYLPPWWQWKEWWTLSWNNMWELWWWWGHPGSLPPDWMSVELSSKLTFPSIQMVDFFAKIPRPDFTAQNGKRALFPTASTGMGMLPKPYIPSIAKPNGQVNAPAIPKMR